MGKRKKKGQPTLKQPSDWVGRLIEHGLVLGFCGILIGGVALYLWTRPDRQGAEAAVQKANKLMDDRNFDAAIRELDKAVRLDPSYPEAHIARGMAHFETKKYDAAISDLDEAIRLAPHSARAYGLRGGSRDSKGEHAEAVNDLSKAIKAKGDDAQFYYLRGSAYLSLKKFDLAIKDYDTVVELDPGFRELYFFRGKAHLLNKNFDIAVNDFDRSLAAGDRWRAESHFYRATAWEGKGEYALALRDFDAAIEDDPKYVEARSSKAWLLATCPDDQVRNGELAVRLATETCELAGGKSNADFEILAAAYAESGDFGKAVEWQLKAMEVRADAAEPSADARLRVERLELYKMKRPYREKRP